MFAVIKTGGKQYRVSTGDIIEVERIEAKPGTSFNFEEVLLIDDGTRTLLGNPYLPKARVKAELLEEFKGEKVIVFKKKRRKQYKRKRGHRQIQSRVKILEIIPDFELKEKEIPEIKPSEELKFIQVQAEELREAEVKTQEAERPSEGVEKEVKFRKKAKTAAKKTREKETKSSPD